MATKLSKNMLIQTGDKSQTLKVQSQTKSHNPIPSKNKKRNNSSKMFPIFTQPNPKQNLKLSRNLSPNRQAATIQRAKDQPMK